MRKDDSHKLFYGGHLDIYINVLPGKNQCTRKMVERDAAPVIKGQNFVPYLLDEPARKARTFQRENVFIIASVSIKIFRQVNERIKGAEKIMAFHYLLPLSGCFCWQEQSITNGGKLSITFKEDIMSRKASRGKVNALANMQHSTLGEEAARLENTMIEGGGQKEEVMKTSLKTLILHLQWIRFLFRIAPGSTLKALLWAPLKRNLRDIRSTAMKTDSPA